MRKCISCGKRLKRDERVCPHCGADQEPAPETEPVPAEAEPEAAPPVPQPYNPYAGYGYPQQGVYGYPQTPYAPMPYGYPPMPYGYPQAPYGYPQAPYGYGMPAVVPYGQYAAYGQYAQYPAYGQGYPQNPYGYPYPYPYGGYPYGGASPYPYGSPYGGYPYGEQPKPRAVAVPDKHEEAKKREEAEEKAFLSAESKFTAGAFSRFFVNLLVAFVSLITLSLAYPAMHCWRERWRCRHTYINGKQLRFDGRGGQLFGKFLLWLLLSVITLGIYAVFCMPLNMQRWTTKHTHFVGSDEYAVSRFDGRIWGLFGLNIASFLVTVITLSFGLYWVLCWREKWFAKHTVIDDYRLRFDGKGIQLFGKVLLWGLLTVVTLGIYSFWLVNNVVKWKTKHTHADVFEMTEIGKLARDEKKLEKTRKESFAK